MVIFLDLLDACEILVGDLLSGARGVVEAEHEARELVPAGNAVESESCPAAVRIVDAHVRHAHAACDLDGQLVRHLCELRHEVEKLA